MTVFPGGITLWGTRLGQRAILANEIRKVGPYQDGLRDAIVVYGGSMGRTLRIDHAGLGVGSPVLLGVPLDSNVAMTISRLVPAETRERYPSGDLPVVRRAPTPIELAFRAVVLVVAYVLVFVGIGSAIPTAGVIGLFWTVVVLAFAASSTLSMARLLRR